MFGLLLTDSTRNRTAGADRADFDQKQRGVRHQDWRVLREERTEM